MNYAHELSLLYKEDGNCAGGKPNKNWEMQNFRHGLSTVGPLSRGGLGIL